MQRTFVYDLGDAVAGLVSLCVPDATSRRCCFENHVHVRCASLLSFKDDLLLCAPWACSRSWSFWIVSSTIQSNVIQWRESVTRIRHAFYFDSFRWFPESRVS